MKKRYFIDNKKLFNFLKNKKYNIIQIKTIRKHKRNGILQKYWISSYCVIYEKMI